MPSPQQRRVLNSKCDDECDDAVAQPPPCWQRLDAGYFPSSWFPQYDEQRNQNECWRQANSVLTFRLGGSDGGEQGANSEHRDLAGSYNRGSSCGQGQC